MKPTHFITLLFLFITISNSNGQLLTEDKALKLENHPASNELFIAKFYSKYNGELLESWMMRSFTDEISIEKYNNLLQKRKILPHGNHTIVYPNYKPKLIRNFENGFAVGDLTGFYDTGEIKFEGFYNRSLIGDLTHYYKNENILSKETMIGGLCNGRYVKYYPENKIQFEAEYKNNKKNGKYISYYKNGKSKRKATFEDGNLLKSKCYNKEGKQIDCIPIFKKPIYRDGMNSFRNKIGSLDLSFNVNNKDTSDLRIILEIDTLGNPHLIKYFFSNMSLLEGLLTEWTADLKNFIPMEYDGVKTPCIINISVPVCANKPLLLGSPNSFTSETRNTENYELQPTIFWEYPKPDYGKVLFITDQMPKFQGGEKALKKYFKKNLIYPKEAKNKKIEGSVYISVIIGLEGEVTNSRISRSVHPLLDAEALRLVSEMPKWTPGKQHGENVRVNYTFPIEFKLY